MKRWQGEIVAAAILVVVMGGGWLWERSRLAGDLRAQREAGERTEAAVRAAATEWASGLATSEAEASFNAFLAGIGDRVRFPDSRSLEESIDRYLRLDAVRFVHVMGADGSVLASTDRKLVATGQAGERGRWALSTAEPTTRQGEDGVIEIAAPVGDEGKEAVFVWVGYDVRSSSERSRPALLGSSGD